MGKVDLMTACICIFVKISLLVCYLINKYADLKYTQVYDFKYMIVSLFSFAISRVIYEHGLYNKNNN